MKARRGAKRRPSVETKPAAAAPAVPARRSDYLTPNEVADRLLVEPVTVRLWATKGLLPSVTTPGGHRRFSTRDVEAFVAKHQRGRTPSDGPSTRVLIIDDDPQFSRHLAGLISAQTTGVVVDVANDGFTAGIKCQAIRPDIVTLDLQMPDMDGYEVCTMLRAMFGRTKPRIVALTTLASAANVERILGAGANACIAKKVAAKVLLREMRLTGAAKT